MSIEWWHVALFVVFIIGSGVAIGIAGAKVDEAMDAAGWDEEVR